MRVNKIVKCLVLRPRIYFSYIFSHFACIFFICFFIFFAILTSFKQIDNDNGYGFAQNLFFSSMYSLKTLIDNINIITIISCIYFFIKTAKNFNICALESFGFTSSVILKPIVIFLIIISLFKTFCLDSLYIRLENYRKDKMGKVKQKYVNLVKGETNFVIIDQDNDNNYTVITGIYDEHNDNYFSFTEAKFFQVKNKKLTTCYCASKAILSKNEFFLLDASATNIQDNNVSQNRHDTIKIRSTYDVENMVSKIRVTNKLEKEKILDIYDYEKLLLRRKSSIKNSAETEAILYFFDNFISLLNAILCCLLSFLFCVQNSREANILKFSLQCFVICFMILRVFAFLMKVSVLSTYSVFCLISATFLLCCFVYFLVLDRDWCNFYRQIIFLKIIKFYKYCYCKFLNFIAAVLQKFKYRLTCKLKLFFDKTDL